MKKRCLIFLFTGLIFFLSEAGAKEPDLIFEHFSTEDGLSNGNVSAMMRDSRGFMWFATWNGLNRYDGHTFKVFKFESQYNGVIASNRVNSITEDSHGNIWMITNDMQVFRLNRITEKLEPIPETESAYIQQIYPVPSGDVWILSSNKGIYRVLTDASSNYFTVVHYHQKSNHPLPDDKIRFITLDSSNDLWINTNKGIVRYTYDAQAESYIHKEFTAEATMIFNKHDIGSFGLVNGFLYFGTANGNVISFDLLNETAVEIKINHLAITSIIVAANGALYLGTSGNGLFEYNVFRKTITNHYRNHEISKVLKTFADSKGMLWIESDLPGISKIDLRSGRFRYYTQELSVPVDIHPYAQCGFLEDENQVLWLSLKGGGFGFYNHETDEVEYFYNKPGDSQSRMSNFVKCFYVESGVLWLSTYFKGIEKVTFISGGFRFIQPVPQQHFSIVNEVRAMLWDSNGYLWVATKNQEIFILDADFKMIKKIEYLNGDKIGMVYAMLEDDNGNIYLGTRGNGLFRLQPTAHLQFQVKHYRHQPEDKTSLSDNNIFSLLQDKHGRIWVGTFGGGLNLLENDRFLHAGNTLSYPGEKFTRVRHLSEDMHGNIWIGTTGGIVLLDNQNHRSNFLFRVFNTESGTLNGIRSNDVFWILCDTRGDVWVASLGGGLARMIKGSADATNLLFEEYGRADGLLSNSVLTIANDDNGNLWMSTENGINFYDREKHIFRSFGRFDGIVNSVFSEGAMAVHPGGFIGFGSTNGFYYFHPSDFENEQKKVRLVFTGFQLLGKEVHPGKGSVLTHAIIEQPHITLRHHQNIFGITWAGLDYNPQHNIQYAYKLEGVDQDWNYVKDLTQANYTRIPPGDYTFWVRFVNPELQELNPPQSVQIKILPPMWKTNRAYLVYLILILLLMEVVRRTVTTIIRLRNKVVIEKKLTEIKLDFFTKISHELRTPLTLILSPARELTESESLSPKGKAFAILIEENAQRLLRLVNYLLDFRKIQRNKMELDLKPIDVVSLVERISRNFDSLAQEKKIRFVVQSPEHPIQVLIDEDKMDSILFNLLSNAFKFTPSGGKIEVSVHEMHEKQTVVIDIVDTGKGISRQHESSLFNVFASTSQSGTGIGLALSNELVLLHQGELRYRPTPGGGATFSILLKAGVESMGTPAEPDTEIHITAPLHPSESPKDLHPGKSSVIPLILVVEDNHELRNFIRMQLEPEYRIIEAMNGSDGWHNALHLQPDIILSDVMMPVMNGIELLDKIKNNFETSHIPVVLLTAKSSVESKIEGLKYGADAYMIKPFHSKQLKAQLENLLHQRVVLRNYFAKHVIEPSFKTGLNITERDAAFLEKVREVIDKRLSDTDLKIEDLYKSTGMGRSKFFGKLKGLTGISPIDFIKEYRLNKAFALFQSEDFNVSEVAYQTGYNDAGYFSKCFKERFGINPSEMIKERKDKENLPVDLSE